MSTLRGRLIAGLSLLTGLVLIPSVLLVWGFERVDGFLEQEHAVETRLEAYQQLSVDAHRYFKQIGDIILLGELTPYTDMTKDFEILLARMEKLQTQARERSASPEELERLGKIDRVLTESYEIFKDLQIVETWEEIGRGWKLLSKMLDENIDRKFRQLVSEAIEEGRLELADLRREYTRLGWVLLVGSVFVGLVSTAAAAAIGLILFRGIRNPLSRLEAGTAAVGHGNLDYRIQVDSPAEFANLAASFNEMTRQLSEQQQKLVESHSNLESTVAERTRELAEANRRLESADETRRRLFLDIGHELRTPLTVIQGEAQVTLRDKKTDADMYRRTLERIADLTQQVTKLVNDLFLLARTELNPEKLEITTVDLKALLAEISDDALMLAQRQNKHAYFDLPERDVVVDGEAYRLKQALLALIDNALRYSYDNGRVEVSLAVKDRQARIEIRDHGIGVPEAEIEHVFERFYRSSAARKHAEQGSGLGLTVARRIFESHGGALSLSSQSGQGTRLVATVPLAQSSILKSVSTG